MKDIQKETIKSQIILQEIYYKIEIKFDKFRGNVFDTLKNYFSQVVVSNETECSAVVEITTHSSISPYYTEARIKRNVWGLLHQVLNVNAINDLDFKEEADMYNLNEM